MTVTVENNLETLDYFEYACQSTFNKINALGVFGVWWMAMTTQRDRRTST